jgi:hypothetical protein
MGVDRVRDVREELFEEVRASLAAVLPIAEIAWRLELKLAAPRFQGCAGAEVDDFGGNLDVPNFTALKQVHVLEDRIRRRQNTDRTDGLPAPWPKHDDLSVSAFHANRQLGKPIAILVGEHKTGRFPPL